MWNKNKPGHKNLSELVDADKEPLTRFNIQIPVDLHQRLKIYCAKKQITMREVVIRNIEKELERE